jgi:hypothetical protein
MTNFESSKMVKNSLDENEIPVQKTTRYFSRMKLFVF